MRVADYSPMEPELTKLLSLLVYPLTQVLLLGLVSLLFISLGRLRLAMSVLLVSLCWLYLCSTALFADFMMDTLEKGYRPKAMSVAPEADAIVVLGGAVRGDVHLGTLGDLNAQADRLLHAANLYRAGKAPMVLVSGGSVPGARAEAKQMEDILEVMGVPQRAVFRESMSRNTYGNAVHSATMLKGKGVETILLVTSAFHMSRAMPLFERQGFEVLPAPTDYQKLVVAAPVPAWLPTVEDLGRTTIALREHVALIVYRYRGWL